MQPKVTPRDRQNAHDQEGIGPRSPTLQAIALECKGIYMMRHGKDYTGAARAHLDGRYAKR